MLKQEKAPADLMRSADLVRSAPGQQLTLFRLEKEERKHLYAQLNRLAELLFQRAGYQRDLREAHRLLYLVGEVGAVWQEDLDMAEELLALHGLR